MKYFRFTKPEYALIAANSIDEAVQLYKDLFIRLMIVMQLCIQILKKLI